MRLPFQRRCHWSHNFLTRSIFAQSFWSAHTCKSRSEYVCVVTYNTWTIRGLLNAYSTLNALFSMSLKHAISYFMLWQRLCDVFHYLSVMLIIVGCVIDYLIAVLIIVDRAIDHLTAVLIIIGRIFNHLTAVLNIVGRIFNHLTAKLLCLLLLYSSSLQSPNRYI